MLQGREEDAHRLQAQAVALHEAIGSRYDVAVDHYNFGLVLRQLGRAGEARPHFLRAAALWEAIGLSGRARRARELAAEG